jgi:flagellar biosynthetic protein FliP
LIALLTVLSPAPSILVDDDLVHPHRDGAVLLRTALGTATSPANSVVISLALFLTALVMGPVLTRVYDVGIKPLVANEISVNEAFDRASGPLRGFMEKNAREKGLRLFVDMSSDAQPQKPDDLSMRVLVPAFMISELKRAFEIGFLLFLPFLIIDLVVASVLMSMGMTMRPPVVVSLPFKLIFFVLVDGWTPVAGALIQSYGPSGRAPSLASRAYRGAWGCLPENSRHRRPEHLGTLGVIRPTYEQEIVMGFGRGVLLWLLGIPLPIIILLAIFWHH